eukprot:jgi/Phyca11/111313/e_gw1.20.201.1
MSRRISTVRELWSEWRVGLSNQPSVDCLDKQYGRKWRMSSKEARFYSRRHCVIKYVRYLIDQGLPVENAVDRADHERGKRSIDAFSKYLNSRKTF